MPLLPIAKGDVEVFDKVIATNLRGAFLVLGTGSSACFVRRTHHHSLEQRPR
jgi:NAD(P)-dependent dehydrogenase (short-subunit alcohol dehydrogenase family)